MTFHQLPVTIGILQWFGTYTRLTISAGKMSNQEGFNRAIDTGASITVEYS